MTYIEAHGVCDPLIVQDLPKDIFTPGAQLNFDNRECVQPAIVIRIPRKHLHQMPGDISLRMTDQSLEAVLKRVDGIAYAIGDPLKGYILPEGLSDRRRREDIITLNLLHAIDRIKQPVIVVQQPFSMEHKKSRKASIWEQGTIPRSGGRGC